MYNESDSEWSSVRTGMDLPITLDTVIASAIRIFKHFTISAKDVAYREGGMLPSEVLAFLSAVILSEVDIVIESGTGLGYSIEVMASVLESSNITLFTIDDTEASFYQKEIDWYWEGQHTHYGHVANRLRRFSNVHVSKGNSFRVIPELLKEFHGKRIALLVDGPKDFTGLYVCLKAINQTKDVRFCAIHDVAPGLPPHLADFLQIWGRTGMLTTHEKWRKYFRDLDTDIQLLHGWNSNLIRGSGFGLGILSGSDLEPYGKHKLDDFAFTVSSVMPLGIAHSDKLVFDENWQDFTTLDQS